MGLSTCCRPLIIAIGLFLFIFNSWLNIDILVANSELVVSNTVSAINAHHNLTVTNAEVLLETLSKIPAIRDGDAEVCTPILEELISGNTYYLTLGVVEKDGFISCSSLPFDKNINVSDRAYIQEAMSTGELSVGEYQIGKVTHEESLNFGFPVKSEEGDVLRVIVVALGLEQLAELTKSEPLPEDSTVLVLDNSATVLANLADGELFVGYNIAETKLGEFILSTEQGLVENEDGDGIKRFYAFAPLQVADGIKSGYVAVGIPKAYFFGNANKLLTVNLVASIIIFSLLLYMPTRLLIEQGLDQECLTMPKAEGKRHKKHENS